MPAPKSPVYDVVTDASPDDISEIALEIFKDWVAFASGRKAIGGRMIVHPTGRYARSIRIEHLSAWHVAIIADETVAPEAAFLELGHEAIDLKEKLQHGKAYRLQSQTKSGAAGWLGVSQHSGSLRATARGQWFSGFRSIGANSPPGSWIIPAMPAYEPGLHLARAAAKALDGRLG